MTVILADAKFGWNRHIWDATADEVRGGLQLQYAATLQFTIASFLIKMSLLVFYHRLVTETTHKFMKIILLVLGILLAVGTIAMLVQMALICR